MSSPEQSRDRLSAEDRETIDQWASAEFHLDIRNALARAILDIRREIQEQAHWATGRGCEACEPTEECGACGRPLDHEELPGRIEALETRVRPNFLRYDGGIMSVGDVSDADLRAIGEAWTEALLGRARRQRATNDPAPPSPTEEL